MSGREPRKPGGEWKFWVLTFGIPLLGFYLVIEGASFVNEGSFLPGIIPTEPVFTALTGLVDGSFQWTGTHTVLAVLVSLLLFACIMLAIILRTGKGKTTAHKAAKHLGTGERMSLKEVTARSEKGRLTTGEKKGVLLVKTMESRPQERYADFRSTGVVVAGPEAGKTTGFVIPIAMDAPGVVFATSNKRDLADGIRSARPGPVWVFDPQRICSKAPPPWRLDLTGYITDEVRAHKLAKIWMDASGPANAKRDAYFDSAGPNLLAGLLLAAAEGNYPITQVFRWLTRPKDRTPIQILEKSSKDYELPAAALEGVYDAPEEQRGGVFGTAAEMVSFLNNGRVRSWLEVQGPDDKRPVFSPEDFVRSGNGTLLALSKEGIGSTGPLTASLTVWVLDAAEEMADEYEHGRLPIPLMVLLDEAANVCRIQDLPDLYSHYGSRGIFPLTFLQSFEQGVRVWTESGMKALWTAANFRIIGAGQADDRFLESMSKLLGERYVTEYSTSSGSGRGGRNTSTSQVLRPIMTVDDLGALELGQWVVDISGGRGFVGTSIPWFERDEMREKVAASIVKNEPKTVIPLPVKVSS
jgi:type IV secretory pathway TraG/TraD family ATPase VirD4